MTRTRPLPVVLAGLVAAVLTLAMPLPAQAAPRDLGGVMWAEPEGTAYTIHAIYADGPCPSEARYVKATMWGHGMPKDGQTIVAPNELALSTTQPMRLSVSHAFIAYGEMHKTALVGDYTVKIRCTDRFGLTSIGDYTTTMRWKTPGGKFKNLDKATYVATNTATVDPATAHVAAGDVVDEVMADSSPSTQPRSERTPSAKPSADSTPSGGATTAAADPTPSASSSVAPPAAAAGQSAVAGGSSDGVPPAVWLAVAGVLAAISLGLWVRSARRSDA